MNKLNRRQFLSRSALGLGSAVLASRIPAGASPVLPGKTLNYPVGFQMWILRDKIEKEFAPTLKMMAGIGYQTIEMCSPLGYKDLGFGSLLKLSGKELVKIINDAGLALVSTHYGMEELRTSLDDRIAFAKDSGQKQMIVSSFDLPENATMSDWMKSADELNKIGVKTKAAGIQLGYHNHHMEFAKLDGKLIYDALMSELDPGLVKMQFQVAVISLGYKAADYFRKYPGRYISAHLADWSPEEKKNVPIGKGIVDWKEFFAATKTGGVQNIFVEMDAETFKDSAAYLHSL
jgi:sugar phosphate isomerase/epimerase